MYPNSQPTTPQQNYAYPTPSQGNNNFRIILYIVGGLMLLFSVFAVLLAGNNTSAELAELAAEQTEIARVAEIAVTDDSSSQITRATASTLQLTSLTAVSKLTNLPHVKLSDSLIEQFKDNSADNILETARKSNEFNDAITQIMSLQVSHALASIKSINLSKLDDKESAVVTQMLSDYELLDESLNP